MELYVINAGNFKLDGGAMFGVVPKVMWQKVYPADDNNLSTWSTRCLLVVHHEKRILIDCGIGDKQDEKFLKNFYLTSDHSLEKSIQKTGFSADDITDVILTHLHFDHCGGAVKFSEDKLDLIPAFKNAVYWISKQQWDLATNPNPREKASYLPENFIPLYDNEKIQFIDTNKEIFPEISLRLMFGHTDGQIIPFIQYKDQVVVYMADFIPSSAHIPLPYILSYDTKPLVTMAEKEVFLREACEKKYILFFEHDFYTECCTLKETEKGIRVDKLFQLKEIL